jgi:DNA polymerase V
MGHYNLDLISTQKIAILDVNNFYVSCERLFQPDFKSKPTVVLSNNDGCIIARSQESKDLGIKMGQPLFKLEDTIKTKLKKFSSNYALYGDISDRIINILKREVPKVEVYSIDEAFLDLTHIPIDSLESEMGRLKELIWKLVGVPVSIGVAPTKTLAKLCNYISKKTPEANGICSFWNNQDKLDVIGIDEVWGIGSKYSKRLKEIGVTTVKDFKMLSSITVRNMMHITGLRTWTELNEVICHPITTEFKKPKMITTSRTFGTTVWEPNQLKNALWQFTHNCHRKLIREDLQVTGCSIFVTTNRFDENYFVYSKQFKLKWQTDDLQTIWNQIAAIIQDIPVRLWYKAGVCFHHLKPKDVKQEVIFYEKLQQHEIPVVDEVKWETRRDFLTPGYTTNWKDIPVLN